MLQQARCIYTSLKLAKGRAGWDPPAAPAVDTHSRPPGSDRACHFTQRAFFNYYYYYFLDGKTFASCISTTLMMARLQTSTSQGQDRSSNSLWILHSFRNRLYPLPPEPQPRGTAVLLQPPVPGDDVTVSPRRIARLRQGWGRLKVGAAGLGLGLAEMQYIYIYILMHAPLLLHCPCPAACVSAVGVQNATTDGKNQRLKR